MKAFKQGVNKGNSFFTLSKSELKPLFDLLGGDYNDSRGEDWRDLNRQKLEAIQECIWPEGVGVAAHPWMKKKLKYKEALGYLASTLFDRAEADALLVGSYKTGWKTWKLHRDMKFVSASGADSGKLQNSGGLSARFASEVCIPHAGMLGDWTHHKFIFGGLMKTNEDGSLKSSGAIGKQGFGSNTYCYLRPTGTTYYCMFDLKAIEDKAEEDKEKGDKPKQFTSEIAFPQDVDKKYVKPYPNGQAADGPWSTAGGWD
jgi:hypothetical protein